MNIVSAVKIAIAASLALGSAGIAVAAQDPDAPVYMGIDLSAQPTPLQTSADQRSVAADQKALLDEGVEIGCLAFAPPATYSQTENRGEACRAFIARLEALTTPHAGSAEGPTAAEGPRDRHATLPLVTIARMAYNGDKRAQFELGKRFEEGRGGVEPDWEKARELYKKAARATPARKGFRRAGGGIGNETSIMTIGQASPRIPGLPEARERLDALEQRMENGHD